MARAKSKTELIETANSQFAKMWGLIDGMTDGEQAAGFSFVVTDKMKEAHWRRDKNLRDVLIHLHEWHNLLLDWINSNQSGELKPFLPESYNWRTYGEMNVKLWEKHQNTELAAAKQLLRDSHEKVLSLIGGLSNEELFEAGKLPWTGDAIVGGYCVSATASHYDWAIKKIKAQLKATAQTTDSTEN